MAYSLLVIEPDAYTSADSETRSQRNRMLDEIRSPRKTVTAELSIGQLLVGFSLITSEQLEQALQVTKITQLALGKVLVITQGLSEDLLKAALQCQTMLRHKQIDLPKATAAMALLRCGEAPTLDEAFFRLGHQPPPVIDYLSELLFESGLVTGEQLNAAITQSQMTGLPLGRVLVHSGNLTESLHAALLNAHNMLQSGTVTMEEAVNSLKSVKKRAPDSKLVEKDFYSLLAGESSLLGELLVQAHCLSRDQLVQALQIGVREGKPLGEVLVAVRILSPGFVQKALEVQQMVLNKALTRANAVKLLGWLEREQISIAEGRERLGLNPESDSPITFVEFAKLLGLISDAHLQQAFNTALKHSDVMLQILLLAEVSESAALKAAAACNVLVERKQLGLEHACVLYDYARKNKLSIEQAMINLNWYQGGSSTECASESLADFESLRSKAEQLLQDNALANAEKAWLQVLSVAERFGQEHPNFVRSMEKLADLYCRTGDLDKAEVLYTRVVVAKTRALPPNSLHNAATINNLAKVYYFMGRYHEAELFAMQFLEIYRANFPHDHPNMACALQNLATLYHMQDKYDQAEPYYSESLRICQTRLGLAHPATIRLSQNYASLLHSVNRASEAYQLDPGADGTVSGSWKSITIPFEYALHEQR